MKKKEEKTKVTECYEYINRIHGLDDTQKSFLTARVGAAIAETQAKSWSDGRAVGIKEMEEILEDPE